MLRTLQRIGKIELKKEIKSGLKKTYLWTIFLKRADSKNSAVNFAGYRLKYCTFGFYEYLFHELFVNQEYCFVTKNESPFIIDCGSNIGMSILYFKMLYPNSKIIAFEPDEDAFLCLKENVETNRLNFVQINQKALSKTEGTIDFYYETENPGSLISSVQKAKTKQKKTVEAVRLSEYINEEVDFLKMDIEGAELQVMEELDSEDKLRHIKQIIIEYHLHIGGEEDVMSKMLRLLENAGFGYQIGGDIPKPLERQQPQGVIIYAYRKDV